MCDQSEGNEKAKTISQIKSDEMQTMQQTWNSSNMAAMTWPVRKMIIFGTRQLRFQGIIII
jgi:hypothetical protein